MPLLFGALVVLFVALGLAAIPMLRDAGPVERLGGRIGGVGRGVRARRRSSPGSWKGSRRGSARGWRRACAPPGVRRSSTSSTSRAGRPG